MRERKIVLVLGGGIGGGVAARRRRGLNLTLPLGKIAFEKYWLFGWS